MFDDLSLSFEQTQMFKETPAQEGAIFTNTLERNFKNFKNKYPLLVVTTDDNMNTFNKRILNIGWRYKFESTVLVDLDSAIDKLADRNSAIVTDDKDLQEYISNEFPEMLSDDVPVRKVTGQIVDAARKYSLEKNILVALVTTDSQRYVYKDIRDIPALVLNISAIKSYLYSDKSPNTIATIRKRRKIFKRFDTRIPLSLFIKPSDLKVNLYHISKTPNIAELTPRITHRPLKTENIGIPRISAASSIDACFRALGVELSEGNTAVYHLYKLIIKPKTRIVRPSTKLVSDAAETGEYWILDPVETISLGYITVTRVDKNKPLEFDTSQAIEDTNIYTPFK